MSKNTQEFTYVDKDGWEIVVDLPTRWSICNTCRGEGQHSLAVDGHGITSEEWEQDWDDEEREGYFRGDYDQPCDDCEGSGKVQEIQIDKIEDSEIRKAYIDHLEYEADYRRICAMERRYGC